MSLKQAGPRETVTNGRAAARSRQLIWLAHLILLTITLVPVLSVEMAPLVDLPNHMARWYILANLDTDPLLQDSYQRISHLSPYLVVDFFAVPLVKIFGAYEAGRMFLAGNMILIYLGVIAVHRAFYSEISLWPALALPVLYNYVFLWGFLNFYFGSALLLFCFSIWIRAQQWSARVRIALLFAQCFLLYFTHILILGLYGLILTTHASAMALSREGLSLRAIVMRVGPIVPPFVVGFAAFMFWIANDDGVGEKITRFGSAGEKLIAFLSPMMMTEEFSDGALFGLLLIGLYTMMMMHKLQIAPFMLAPLIAMAALCAAMPTQLLGVYGVDFRFPPILIMFTIAATRPRALVGISRTTVTAAICMLVFGRVATLWEPFKTADREFAEYRTAVVDLAPGSRVLSSVDYVQDRMAMPLRSYWHWGSIAAIETDAFVPTIFTGITQLRPTAQTREIDTPCGPVLMTPDLENGLNSSFLPKVMNFCERFYWSEWPKQFDYLVRLNPLELPKSFLPYVAEREIHNHFEIIRLKK